MSKRFLIVLALLVLFGHCFAISAQEAVDFATKKNNFLYSGETVEIYPNVRISDRGRDYWVITVLSSDSLACFVPVRDSSSPVLADSAIARRELIKTNYVLRYERELAEASAQQGVWLFDAQNVKFFSDLEQDLKNERVDLTTIWTSLDGYPALQSDVESLISGLDGMYPVAGGISDQLLDATSFESSFVAEPDTNKLNDFEHEFLDSFALISDLEQKRSSYLADLDALRQSIALTGLALETKQGLNSLANVPSRFQQFGSKVSLAVNLEEKISLIFDNASVNADSLVLDLATREKRNVAFQALFGQDAEVLEETGQGSLEQLVNVLLSDDYFFLWENQGDLGNAKEYWEKAKAFYDSGSFQQAEQYAKKAKTSALRVYAAGLKDQEPVFDTDLLFSGIVLLIVAVIIIYAVRNRDKLSSLVSGSGDEEVEF